MTVFAAPRPAFFRFWRARRVLTGPFGVPVGLLCLAAAATVVSTPALADPVWLGATVRGDLDGDLALRVRASLERSLAKQGVAVLDTSSAAEDTADQANSEAASALDEATGSFSDGEWAAALAASGKALEAFEHGPAFSDDTKAWTLYRDIQSLRALTFLKQKKKKEADAALRALLVVMPKYAPRKDRAPAELVRHVDDVKDELRSLPPTTLEIRSKPAGGTVIVDGRKRGKAPLILDDLVPGVHYLAVEGNAGRHTERIELDEQGATVRAKLGSRKGAAARDLLAALKKPTTAPAFVELVSDVDDDALVAVLMPAGKGVDVVAARVSDGEVRVVCGVRMEDNENDRERASYVLVEGLLDRERDAWLDKAAGEDAATLRPRLFSGVGTLEEDAAPTSLSPALIAVGVLGGVAVLAGVGTGVGLYVAQELKKDEGFTWSVDTSGL